MGAGEGGGAGVEGLAVDAVRPPEGPALLEGAGGGGGRARGSGSVRERGVAAGVEAVAPTAWRRSRRRRRGLTPFRRRARSAGTSAAVAKLATCPRACTPASVRPATVSCDRLAQDRRQRRLQLSLHGPQPRLPGPAARSSDAVVFDVQPHASAPRRSMPRTATRPRIAGACASSSPTTTGSRPPACRRPAAPCASSTASSVDVIAPDSNRSATARSITTRSPLTVEEVEFGDGDVGYATDGTPVDCVRFAELGLVGGRPDLIVSGINHGANLGDDITYSGTVAAALRGDRPRHPRRRLLPAVLGRRHGLRQRPASTSASPPPSPPSWSPRWRDEPMPEATLINVNCPAGEPSGVEVTKLGKRDLQRRAEAGRRGRRTAAAATRSTAGSPATRRSRGPTSTRSPQGRISVTPIHFDLTDHGGLERLRGWGFEEMLAASAPAA